MGEVRGASWQRLEGKIADAIFAIPSGTGTSRDEARMAEISDEIVHYLHDQVAGMPWMDHLALIAAVLNARGMSEKTILSILYSLHPRFWTFFETLGIRSMAEWNAEHFIPAYLKGELLPDDSLSMRKTFWERYNSATRNVRDWLEHLPAPDQRVYRSFTLPVIRIQDGKTLIKTYDTLRRQREIEMIQREGLVDSFAAIRAAAHLRTNRLSRLHRHTTMPFGLYGGILPSYRLSSVMKNGLILAMVSRLRSSSSSGSGIVVVSF